MEGWIWGAWSLMSFFRNSGTSSDCLCLQLFHGTPFLSIAYRPLAHTAGGVMAPFSHPRPKSEATARSEQRYLRTASPPPPASAYVHLFRLNPLCFARAHNRATDALNGAEGGRGGVGGDTTVAAEVERAEAQAAASRVALADARAAFRHASTAVQAHARLEVVGEVRALDDSGGGF